MVANGKLIRAGLWRWLQGPGLERFEFLRLPDAWLFRGTILTSADNGPSEVRYEILCDSAFCTRNATISVHDNLGDRRLEISARDGLWLENGRENQTVKGAIDIDLGWSPATNTLPIRRLGLKVGEPSGEFIAAWVRFPDLTLQPLPQEYVRLAENQYRYSSRGGAFVAGLNVDEHGLVLDYEGFWQRATGGPV
jgi:hypothetical protein